MTDEAFSYAALHTTDNTISYLILAAAWIIAVMAFHRWYLKGIEWKRKGGRKAS